MKPLRLLLPLFVGIFLFFTGASKFAKADDTPSPVAVNFEVEGSNGTIFNQNIQIPDCTTPNNASSTINGFCAFNTAGLTVDASWSPAGVVINAINSIAADTANTWHWFLNGNLQSGSFDSYIPQTGDAILWSLGRDPFKLTIKDGANTAFSGNIILPAIGAPDVLITPTGTTTSIAVPARSVLGILKNLSATSTDFSITDISYSAAQAVFSINCIAVPVSAAIPDCGIWTFAVNGIYPLNSINQQLINSGDTVYLFLGTTHKTNLSSSSIAAGQQFTATAQQFDLTTGNYKPLTGVTIGAGTLNTDSSFTETASSTVDANGQAIFTINSEGNFSVGIKDDDYQPLTSITITSATGGGGATGNTTFNLPLALAFISSKQNPDGSIDSVNTSNWAAIAFASLNPGSAKDKLKNYLLTSAPAPVATLDYEQRAMALMALGVNPYSGSSINYIAQITNAFDGTQIGTTGDVDDIFALIVLEHAGFTSSDPIIQKEAAYILSKQQPNGAWDKSPDMTAAAIQALGLLFDIHGVNASLGQAAGFLASTEQPNGSWGNIDSTSWVQIAINAIIEAHTPGFDTEAPWTTQAGSVPTDALAAAQQPDGGVTAASRILSTSYAITAASGRSWVSLLGFFQKTTASALALGGGIGNLPGSTATSTATSTINSLTNPQASSTQDSITPETKATSTYQTTLAIPSPIPTPIKSLKPKVTKLQAKTKKPAPEVLGVTTTQPTPTQAPTEPSDSETSNHENGFSLFWHAISSLFLSIF